MSSAPKKSMWWQAGPFEQWVQEVLISVLVPEGASVCELMCGSGKALGKWQRAKLGQYVGVGACDCPTRLLTLLSLTLARGALQMPRSMQLMRPSSGGRAGDGRFPPASVSPTRTL